MNRRLIRRDFPIACALFLATAIFVLWQNSRVAVLWDLTYLLDTSWRIALGQVPYRDFPLVHPPLTFLIQAGLMRLFGRLYMLPVLYAAGMGGLATVLTWRILLNIVSRRIVSAFSASILLTLPLIFLGIYSVYPHPIYDCDSAFAVLIATYLLQRLLTNPDTQGSRYRQWIAPLATGSAVVLPLGFKQNIGLPFLFAVVLGILLLLLRNLINRSHSEQTRLERTRLERTKLLWILAGIAIAAFLSIAGIELWAGIENYLHWTVHFAAERRLPGFADMLAVYQVPSLLWTLPSLGGGLLFLHSRYCDRLWRRIAACILCAAPFLVLLVQLAWFEDVDDRADHLLAIWPLLLVVAFAVALLALRRGLNFSRILPFCVLAAIHGSFLSQQLWGSTYAIWPLLLILVAQILAEMPRTLRQIPLTIAIVVSASLLTCASLYAVSHERLNYVHLSGPADNDSDLTEPASPVGHTAWPSLRGMADRGPYLADFDELLRFAEGEIPRGDSILLLPGEEPFFYASGRTPQFPVSILDRTTDPYSPVELLAEARRTNVRWVIVKTRLQLLENPLPDGEETLRLVAREFELRRRLAGYDVYFRR